jgi:sulfite exporter TauE/SafE
MAPLAPAAFLLGLLGSAHCAAMCGGFARAGSASAAALHAGRIASYAAAGALAGAAGSAPAAWFTNPSLRFAAFAVACAILFASGLRVAGLVPVPAAGGIAHRVGRVASMAARRIGSPRTAGRSALLGMLWGWAPCALVYSALPVALVSGSAASGAVTMAAFGLGTVPALLGAGWVIGLAGTRSRRIAGVLLMLLAVAALLATAATDPWYCVA